MDRYPVIAFLLKNKSIFAPAVAALVLVFGIYLSIRIGAIDFAVIAALMAPIMYVIVRSYLELIDVIAEMLLPH